MRLRESFFALIVLVGLVYHLEPGSKQDHSLGWVQSRAAHRLRRARYELRFYLLRRHLHLRRHANRYL